MTKKLKPVGPMVLVKVLFKEAKEELKDEVSAGGIIIEAKEQKIKHLARDQHSCNKGEIIAMGALAFKDFEVEDECKVGDIVLFPKYCGLDREIDGHLYRIIFDEDIKAIEEKGDE